MKVLIWGPLSNRLFVFEQGYVIERSKSTAYQRLFGGSNISPVGGVMSILRYFKASKILFPRFS